MALEVDIGSVGAGGAGSMRLANGVGGYGKPQAASETRKPLANGQAPKSKAGAAGGARGAKAARDPAQEMREKQLEREAAVGLSFIMLLGITG